ncbi:MAG: TOBE domain-containing protein, partial [Pseudomonadota bacterium]
ATLALETPAKFIDGAPVKVAIRPEKADLQADAGSNVLSAKVTFVRDVGPTRDIHVDTEAGPFIIEYALGENARDFHVGDTVAVHLPPGALHVFPAADRQAA